MASEAPPTNANESCVGPSAGNAGKASSCEGCPNQSTCASGQFSNSAAQQAQLSEHESIRVALSNVQHVVMVLSGKGGVGKSTVCCQLAYTLASRGYKVGVLDVDICGPSVARMLGCNGKTVHKSGSGWSPVVSNENLLVMSVSFLLGDEDAAVVWRGPRKNGMIKQFLTDTYWGEDGLDYLLIDTPPGTSDEHISTVQLLQGALGASGENDHKSGESAKLSGAIVVTTPEEVAMADVRKELNFCVKTRLPVIGIVENMATFQTRLSDLTFLRNDRGDCTNEALAKLKAKCPELMDMIVSADVFPAYGSGPRGMASTFNVPYLGSIPLDTNLLRACEEGLCFVQAFPISVSVAPLNVIADSLVNVLPVEYEYMDDE